MKSGASSEIYLPVTQFLSQIPGQLQQLIRNIDHSLSNVSLNTVGFVALAEITAVARRTVLIGTSTYSDIFILCPGLHRQQSAPELSGGECPAVAALTTGYVFRVENPATVQFLLSKGKAGHLVTVQVSPPPKPKEGKLGQILSLFDLLKTPSIDWIPYLLSFTAACASPALLLFFICLQEWYGVAYLLALIFARLCNVVVIRRRCIGTDWKGASEPGVKGDLLILMSGDRWIRMQGYVDDLKAMTSGQWWRDRTISEELISTIATLLVYTSTIVVGNMTSFGQAVVLVLFIVSAFLLLLSNATTTTLQMYGRKARANGAAKKYRRRRDMAEELILETGRRDWAQRLGLIVESSKEADTTKTPVVM